MSQESRPEAPRKRKRRSKDESDEPAGKRAKASNTSAEVASKPSTSQPNKRLSHPGKGRPNITRKADRVDSWTDLSGLSNFDAADSLSTVPLSQLYHGSLGGGEPESGDSDSELLGKAGAWTEEEATILYRSKLYRLQQLYLSQCSRLRHILHLHRRQYLQRIESINDGNLGAASDIELPLSAKAAEYAAAIRRYRRRFGHDAVLRLRLIERRRQASLATPRTSRRASQGTERRSCTFGSSDKPAICMYMTNRTRCPEQCLPTSRYCRKHICSDTSQHLFVPCRKVMEDGSLCGQPLPAYLGKPRYRCVLHADLPHVDLNAIEKHVEAVRSLHQQYIQKREEASTAMTIAAAAKCVASDSGTLSETTAERCGDVAKCDKVTSNSAMSKEHGKTGKSATDEKDITKESSFCNNEEASMEVDQQGEVSYTADSAMQCIKENKDNNGECEMDIQDASEGTCEEAGNNLPNETDRQNDEGVRGMSGGGNHKCEQAAHKGSAHDSISRDSGPLVKCSQPPPGEADTHSVHDRADQSPVEKSDVSCEGKDCKEETLDIRAVGEDESLSGNCDCSSIDAASDIAALPAVSQTDCPEPSSADGQRKSEIQATDSQS